MEMFLRLMCLVRDLILHTNLSGIKFLFNLDFSSFRALKGTTKAPKMLLSLGGAGSASIPNFVTISQSATLRSNFATSCLNVCKQYGLNGIDVDWEYPGPNDKKNFVLLLAAVKAKLAPAGYLLTVAVGASNWWAVNAGGLDIAGVAA